MLNCVNFIIDVPAHVRHSYLEKEAHVENNAFTIIYILYIHVFNKNRIKKNYYVDYTCVLSILSYILCHNDLLLCYSLPSNNYYCNSLHNQYHRSLADILLYNNPLIVIGDLKKNKKKTCFA